MEKYRVGERVEGVIEQEWLACIVSCVYHSNPVRYGVISILEGKNAELTTDEIRRPDTLLEVAIDSDREDLPECAVVNFVDGQFQEKINFSLIDSDDDQSIFITQSNPIPASPTGSDQSCNLEDSLLDFADEASKIQLSSPPREPDNLSIKQSPVGNPIVYETVLHEKDDRFYIPDGVHAVIEETVLVSPPKGKESVVNKPPLAEAEKKSVRFPVIDVAQLDQIQLASKSKRTHKQMVWGVNVLKGEFLPVI